MRGTVLDDRYTLVERIGAGGMGDVWRARDERLARDVAVKTLSLPSTADGPHHERLLAMFLREARAAASLDSSYIVPVFDHGKAGDVPYLVMPLLSGRTVRDVLAAEGPLPPRRAADIADQVCRALATAHRAGVIHRDIKPANVMVTIEGTIKVLDFGIAKFVGAATDGGYLTKTSDSPAGTLLYMAPERFTRRGDGSPADLYSLGCMVFELLTGAPPFEGASAVILMHDHVYEPPPRPSGRRPGLDPRWDALLGALLEKTPQLRPTAEQAREAFASLSTRSAGGGAAGWGGFPARPPVSPVPPARPAPPPPAAPPPRPLAPPPSPSRSAPPVPPPQSVPSVSAPRSAPSTRPTAPPAAAKPSLSAAPEPRAPVAPGSSPPATPEPVTAPGPSDVPASVRTAEAPGTAVAGLPGRGPAPARPEAAAAGSPPAAASPEVAGVGRRRRWWVGGIAVVVVAVLIATLTVLHPFGDKGSTASGGGPGERATGGSPSEAAGEPAKVAPVAEVASFTVGTAADSKGPARPVTGAKRGGVVTVLEEGSASWDAEQTQFGDAGSPTYGLVYRTLTGFKTDPDGSVKLVGDLAKDPGKPSSDGRTWTFTLKPGIKYSDGTPVRAADFRRSIAQNLKVDNEGSLTLLHALFKSGVDGLYDPNSIETPDDRTLRFRLTRPCPDFNVLMSDQVGIPLPAVSDEVPATGPYKVSNESDTSVTLARNAQWEAASDPLRTAYPDRFEIDGEVSARDVVSRIGAAGAGEAVVAPGDPILDNELPPEADESLQVTEVPANHVAAYVINTARVENLAVRRAIATALPAQDVLRAHGGGGAVTHHLMPPRVRGSDDFDLHGAGQNGDPEKARAILNEAGEIGFRITLGSDDTGQAEEAIKAGLEKAGFRVTLKEVSFREFWPFPQDGDFDMFPMFVAGYGLPVASTSFYDTFDGRRGPPFAMNMAQLQSSAVDSAIDAAISADSVDEAGELWSAVDREVMKQAAYIPVFIPTEKYINSPALGGLQVNSVGLSPLNAYVRK